MVKNAKTLPKVYYGLHMCPGVAEYRDPSINNGEPHRIFIDEPVIKNMDSSFQGKPLYVFHKDEVNLEDLQNDADGYVVESFFNKMDGKHWAKFIVVSDRGHEAISKGWKLSNAYVPKQYAGGGLWHGVEYTKEVMQAEYEHLAIVPNPRYSESVILTPEEFKTYNNEKELELKKLTNSKDKGERSMFNFFKKTKLENAADFEGSSVVLPKSKKELTLEQVVNMADEMQMAMNEEMPLCNIEHCVEIDGAKMKVSELLEKYLALKGAKAENKVEEVKEEVKEVENTEKPIEDKKEEVKNTEKTEEEAKEEKKQNSEHFKKVANAHIDALQETVKLELSEDMIARGKSRYGSNK